MGGSEDLQFRESFSKFLRAVAEFLNSDSAGWQFGKSDVYDNAQIISNITRAPCSRTIGKGNPRDGDKRGKGTRREANVTNWEDKPGETDNRHMQEGGYEGDDGYRDIFGEQTMDVRYARGESEAPIDLDGGGGIGGLWGRK